MLSLFISATALTAKQASPVLKLRGGLAGVSPETVATGLLTLNAVNSGFVALAPEPAAQAYGMTSPTPLQVSFIENMGMLLVGLTIAGFAGLKGVPVNKAVAYMLMPPLANTAKWPTDVCQLISFLGHCAVVRISLQFFLSPIWDFVPVGNSDFWSTNRSG